MLTPAQQVIVKADILASADLNVFPDSPDGAFGIRDLYALAASPDYWVYKTSLTKSDLTDRTSPDGTNFSYSGPGGYISRSPGELSAWADLFTTDSRCDPSLPQVRQAFADIFSGAGAFAVSNRTHIAAMFRRKANRLEKLLATGNGAAATPSTMNFEGTVSYAEIQEVRK